MTEYVGGKRHRLIKASFGDDIQGMLDALSWTSTNRRHKPVKLIVDEYDPAIEIKPNLIGITVEDMRAEEIEMGSTLDENSITCFIDIFAENNSIGQHITGDLYDCLKGKYPNVKEDNLLPVYDPTAATPEWIFNCFYENVETNRNREWDQAFNKYWWTIALDIIDYYG